ncbi:sugar transporter ESL1-like [Pistacia vera]|uniref:sugar transporter ESL1-like n=1 Tax=Pistacia vera TaxID=55513 RepID=UPI0012633C50|nr:sugar transporter ESL1-like [Pistacia vera]
MEEGLLPRSSVPETKSNTKSIADGDSSVTSVVVLSTLVSICGSFAYGCTAGYSSPAESGIMEDLQLSVAAYSVFGSLTTVGGIIGSFMNGIIPDLIGRKGTMWLSELLCIFGWLAIAFSKGAWLLDIGRLSTGIGAGMIAYVVPIYIAEITPKDVRGGFTQASQLMMTCGFSLMFFLGTIVSWRTLAFIGSVPCLLQVFGLFFIPESPRWLAKIGREKELETTLQSFRGKNADVLRAADIKDYTKTFERDSEAGILNMFQRRYAYSLLVNVVGLMALQQLGGSTAIGYYASSIFEEADFSTSLGTVSMAIILIPASCVSTLLIDNLEDDPFFWFLTVECAYVFS